MSEGIRLEEGAPRIFMPADMLLKEQQGRGPVRTFDEEMAYLKVHTVHLPLNLHVHSLGHSRASRCQLTLSLLSCYPGNFIF